MGMTTMDIQSLLLGFNQEDSSVTENRPVLRAAAGTKDLPEEIDWRTKAPGAVTPVKDQKMCGSCWAFSATGSLEGQHFLKTNKSVSLSEQNLVDCSKKEGNMGCFGGLMDNAFKYIKINNGIDTEKSYPYTARDGNCTFSPDNVGATVTGFVDIEHGSEAALQMAVGYGVEKPDEDGHHAKNYWLVKNSWNTTWGDEGYIKMAKNHKNACGIATQ